MPKSPEDTSRQKRMTELVFLENINMGVVDDHFIKNIDAYKVALGAVFEEVQNEGGARTLIDIDTPVQASVVSTSINDDATGLGIRRVIVEGIVDDGSGVLIIDSEEVIMDGTTPALTTKLFSRITDFYISQAGANQDAEGNITVSLSANVSGKIDIGDTSGYSAHMTTGTNSRAFISNFSHGGFGSQDEIMLQFRDLSKTDPVFRTVKRIMGDDKNPINGYLMIPKLHDFRILAKGTGTPNITINYDIVLGNFSLP